MTTDEKLKVFAALVEKEQIEELQKNDLGCEGNIHNARTTIIPGKKYVKVDVGRCGKFMVDGENIFGIKGYGKIHRGHYYGNLDTINDYYWGTFYPTKKEAV